MGMSASQVRFLSLQNRKNDIGHELMTLSNRKLALSSDMNRVSKNYTNALNQIHLKFSNNNGINTVDLDYDLLMKPNDLNCDMPFIVSDRQGRVVVDDAKILITGSDGNVINGDTTKQLSYRELAELISEFSAITPNDTTGKVKYDNTTRVTRDGADKAISGQGTLDPNAYTITTNFNDFNLNDAFRMDLFERMGLITKKEHEDYDKILDELYGNNTVRQHTGDYGSMLKEFDNNKKATLSDWAGQGTFGYSDVFGELSQRADGIFELNGGCAYGNLELAKAYRDEYKAYLNTPLKHDILVDTTNKIGTAHYYEGSSKIIPTIDELDNSNYFTTDEYRYNADANYGISFRTAELLNKATLYDGKEVNNINLNSNGNIVYNSDCILRDLKFYTYDAEKDKYYSYVNFGDTLNYWGVSLFDDTVQYYDTEKGGYSDPGTLYRYTDNGTYVDKLDFDNWGVLYDFDGHAGTFYDFETHSLSGEALNNIWNKSYDTDNDGYFTGKVSNAEQASTDQNQRSGIVLYKIDLQDGVDERTVTNNIIECLRVSSETIDGIDKNGLKYAEDMTKAVYENDTDTDWTNSLGRDDNKGVVIGYNQPTIYMPNLINTFWTFYQMYESVHMKYPEKDDDAIRKMIAGPTMNVTTEANTTSGKYSDVVASVPTYYDKNFAKSISNCSTNSQLADYFNKGGTGFTKDDMVNISGNTFKFERENGDGSVTKLTLEGNYDAATNQFTSVSSIQETIDYADGRSYEVRNITRKGNNYIEKYYEKKPDGSYEQMSTVTYEGTQKPDGSYEYTATIENLESDGTTHRNFVGKDGLELHSAKLTLNIEGNASHIEFSKDGSSYCTADALGDGYNLKAGVAYYIQTEPNSGIMDTEFHYLLLNKDANHSVFASNISIRPDDKYSSLLDSLVESCQQKVDELERGLENYFTGFQMKLMEYFDAVFKRISLNGWVYDDKINDTNNAKQSKKYLDSMFQNNQYFITEAREIDSQSHFKYSMKQAMNVSKIFEVHDDDAENMALAVFNREKTEISSKEKKIDRRMTKLETEQEAINTEMESIKKVENDNIERFFKIFA